MPLGLGVIAEICGNTCCQSQWECHVLLVCTFFPYGVLFQATQQLSIQTKIHGRNHCIYSHNILLAPMNPMSQPVNNQILMIGSRGC